jgi:hypothetical protein
MNMADGPERRRFRFSWARFKSSTYPTNNCCKDKSAIKNEATKKDFADNVGILFVPCEPSFLETGSEISYDL